MRHRLNLPSFRHCLIVFVSLSAFSAAGQVFFSVQPDYIKTARRAGSLLKDYRSDFPDTSIAGLHQYMPRNILGNHGLPSIDYLLRFRNEDAGFRFFEPPYQNDRFQTGDVTFFRTKGPFASLAGITGSRALQIFDALFTQSYRSRINIALGFRRYTSTGYYRRQQTYTNNFYFSSNFVNARGKFGYDAFFLNNANRHHESGGIADGFLTDSTVMLDKELLFEKLVAANRDNRENIIELNPWVRLAGNDSTPGMRTLLSFRSRYKGATFEYGGVRDTSERVYRDFFVDSVTTADSARLLQLSNELALVFRNDAGSGLQAGYRHELTKLWQAGDSMLVNHILAGDFNIKTGSDSSRQLKFRGNAQYVVGGPNVGNHVLGAGVTWMHASRPQQATLDISIESRDPDQIYRRWFSNHFRWYNPQFRPVETSRVRLAFQIMKGLTVGVVAERVTNRLYFDTLALPAQLPGTVTGSRFFLSFSRVLWHHLGLSLDYSHQSTSAPYFVRLPEHHAAGSLYYQSFMFRNKLQLVLGVGGEMFSGFGAYAYMPATQAFYLQDGVVTQPYPYANVFLNVRIRPVSVFFRLENALKGFAGPDYFLAPGYYQPDRALRMGLRWLFFD